MLFKYLYGYYLCAGCGSVNSIEERRKKKSVWTEREKTYVFLSRLFCLLLLKPN